MLLNVREVAKIIGIGKTSIYRHIEAGRFPKPVRISPRRVGWRQTDIDAFVASLKSE